MDKILKGSILKVTWIDPHSVDEWIDIGEILLQNTCKIVSVGILIDDLKDKILLALNYDISGSAVSCSMIIPKACILSIEEIGYV